MQEVEVEALSLEVLASILTPTAPAVCRSPGREPGRPSRTRTIWHGNATAHGGGVAGLLQTLLAYGRGARVENRWLVLTGEPEFFSIIKRLHNRLHGEPGDGGSTR